MELDQIETFVAIVRRGSFTDAGTVLALSQPAVSRRIDLLEHALGASVFERTRGGILLTDAGRAFLPYAETLLASMRDGMAAVRALEGHDHGAMTLAVVGTLASTSLTGCLRSFRAAYPRVELRVRTALSREVSALERRGDAPLGLRYDVDADPELVCRTVHRDSMVPVCSAAHPLARRGPLRPNALRGETWVAFPARRGADGEPYTLTIEGRLAAAGLGGAEIIPIDSLTAQKRMVEAGFGLRLFPLSSVDEELRAGTLRRLSVRALHATIDVVMIHRRRAYLSGATQRMMTALAQWAGRPTTAAATVRESANRRGARTAGPRTRRARPGSRSAGRGGS